MQRCPPNALRQTGKCYNQSRCGTGLRASRRTVWCRCSVCLWGRGFGRCGRVQRRKRYRALPVFMLVQPVHRERSPTDATRKVQRAQVDDPTSAGDAHSSVVGPVSHSCRYACAALRGCPAACPTAHGWAVDSTYNNICWHCGVGTYRDPKKLNANAPHLYTCRGWQLLNTSHYCAL